MSGWQGQQGSNPRPAVLETAALPTELYPYRGAVISQQGGEFKSFSRKSLSDRRKAAGASFQALALYRAVLRGITQTGPCLHKQQAACPTLAASFLRTSPARREAGQMDRGAAASDHGMRATWRPSTAISRKPFASKPARNWPTSMEKSGRFNALFIAVSHRLAVLNQSWFDKSEINNLAFGDSFGFCDADQINKCVSSRRFKVSSRTARTRHTCLQTCRRFRRQTSCRMSSGTSNCPSRNPKTLRRLLVNGRHLRQRLSSLGDDEWLAVRSSSSRRDRCVLASWILTVFMAQP